MLLQKALLNDRRTPPRRGGLRSWEKQGVERLELGEGMVERQTGGGELEFRGRNIISFRGIQEGRRLGRVNCARERSH